MEYEKYHGSGLCPGTPTVIWVPREVHVDLFRKYFKLKIQNGCPFLLGSSGFEGNILLMSIVTPQIPYSILFFSNLHIIFFCYFLLSMYLSSFFLFLSKFSPSLFLFKYFCPAWHMRNIPYPRGYFPIPAYTVCSSYSAKNIFQHKCSITFLQYLRYTPHTGCVENGSIVTSVQLR
jgi:hypothetical protein